VSLPSGTPATPVVNAMTVDVEDYFQVSAFDTVVPRRSWDTMESRVVRNTERLLGMFDEHRVRATFFVLGWVAERYPELLRTIAGCGHEIASHGYGHGLVYEQSAEAFREDIRRSKATIEAACAVAVRGYRAPSFSITMRSLWALDILIEEGFEYDASIFPIHHDRYGIPSSPRHPYRIERGAGSLVEAPGSTTSWGPFNMPVAGGGYFRILPYAWTKWGMRRINHRDARPAIFYIHPWEIDPGQPRMAAGRMSRFRHYRNLDRTEGRLRRLLADFRFDTLRSLVADSTLPTASFASTAAAADRRSPVVVQ
jgi:polysaccharide deacetylase family protein (PEP-CTERM system associated)